MKHRFYQKSEKKQKQFILIVSLGLLVVFLVTLYLAFITKQYWLSLIIAPIIMMAAPFIDTPMGKRNGKLTYYSPMFITEKADHQKTIFHGGTLFDYCFTLDFSVPGYARTRWILLGYLKGLLNFIEAHQELDGETQVLEGTSYILDRKSVV